MKDIKTTNEYIPNELIPEYFDKKYNLTQGIHSVNEETVDGQTQERNCTSI